jgi:hypothetical protein
MKLIKYVLTPEGTIPEYVTDGGYLAWKNSGTWPQDLDLIGVANDSATEESFANKAALLAYVQEKGFRFEVPHTDEVIPLETIVDAIWEKLG